MGDSLFSFRLLLLASALLWLSPTGPAFPEDAPGERAVRITVDSKKPGQAIPSLLYGTNVFWVPEMNGLPDRVSTEGAHREALEKWYGYLPIVSGLGPTLLRFPGGLSANFYIWHRGIGPFSSRKRMTDRPGAVDPLIGTDEFLLLCEELGAEAMITVNLNRASGVSPLQMLLRSDSFYRENAAVAADWVEYCNAPNDGSNPRGGKDWAAERAANGHAEPYGVKYWELGNELQDLPVEMYQKAVRIFSREMRAADPSIRIGALTPLQTWQADRTDEWFRRIGGEEKDGFDFWIRHTYMPSTSGEIRGFSLTGTGASISVPLQLPGRDEYEFRIPAMTLKGSAELTLSIPETGAKQVCGVGRRKKECSIRARLGEKACTLRLELTGGDQLLLYHVAEREGERTGPGLVDCKRSPELYHAIVSGPLVAERRWFSREQLQGKPVCVTEYNSAYETYGQRGRTPFAAQVYSLRDALSLGMFLQTFIRSGVEAATQWLLYGDQECFGLIEGVGRDERNGNERGRPDPRPRPSYHMLKLFRDHLNGRSLPVEIHSPAFTLGPPAPHAAMGYVGHERIEVSLLQGVASLDAEGRRLCLLVLNVSEGDALTAMIELRGFSPAGQADRYTLVGGFPWSTNEPEDCPEGDCVRIEKEHFSAAGPAFACTFPPHSATALVLYGKDARRDTVGPPRNLRGTLRGARVRLTWEPPEGNAPAGYNLYRSRIASGPFRNRIGTLPAAKSEAHDTLQEPGDYTYAVRAFNGLGEEGPWTDKVRFTYGGTPE